MTMLPTDSGFFRLVSGDIGFCFTFAPRLFDFLRVIRKAVMLSFGHG